MQLYCPIGAHFHKEKVWFSQILGDLWDTWWKNAQYGIRKVALLGLTQLLKAGSTAYASITVPGYPGIDSTAQGWLNSLCLDHSAWLSWDWLNCSRLAQQPMPQSQCLVILGLTRLLKAGSTAYASITVPGYTIYQWQENDKHKKTSLSHHNNNLLWWPL